MCHVTKLIIRDPESQGETEPSDKLIPGGRVAGGEGSGRFGILIKEVSGPHQNGKQKQDWDLV